MEPIDVIQAKLDELNSQIEAGKREGNAYITTGHDKLEAVEKLEAEAKKFEDFIVQNELDSAERAVRAGQVETAKADV